MVKKILVFLYFLFATLYITYPLIFNLTDTLPSLGDESLITWIISWNIHSFITDPSNIFNANIFYPYQNSLSFSDAFFTSSVIAFPFILITGQPAIAYNINLIISLATLGFFTYLLVLFLSKDQFSGIISGTLVAFSTYTLNRTMHLQLISIQWIPLCILFFLLYIKKQQFKYLIFLSIFFILQSANSFFPGYFLLLCFSIILLSIYLKDKKSLVLFFNKKVYGLIILTGFVLLPIAIPYFKTSSEFSYVRDIRDAIHFANRPEYTFYPNGSTRLEKFLIQAIYPKDKGPYFYDGYIGLAFFILTFFMIIYRFIFSKKDPHNYFLSFFIIGISSFILSLGPVLQWGGRVIKDPFIIPLPYAVLYYLIPGFKGFRNSARWEMLMLFVMSIAIGLALAKLMSKKSLLVKIFITFIICATIILEFNFPKQYAKVPKKEEFPKVYSFINTLPKDAVIIEFPIYNWDMLPYSKQELMREYFSTAHFRKMVNGGSGFTPSPWQEMVRSLMIEFPNNKSLDSLKKIKVKYIILHKSEYKILSDKNFKIKGKDIIKTELIENNLENNAKVKLIKQFGKDYVYEIL